MDEFRAYLHEVNETRKALDSTLREMRNYALGRNGGDFFDRSSWFLPTIVSHLGYPVILAYGAIRYAIPRTVQTLREQH